MVALMDLAGCTSVSVNYSALNSPPRPLQMTAPDKVELFTTARPSRKYVEVGTMTADHDSIASNEDMFKAMREEAAKRGCDGLVITQRASMRAVAACIAYTE